MRQPKALPMALPPGSPSRLAMVMPPMNSENAAPRRSCGTSLETTTLPAPKKTPWPQAESSRASRSKP
jgi:hypothetical protein